MLGDIAFVDWSVARPFSEIIYENPPADKRNGMVAIPFISPSTREEVGIDHPYWTPQFLHQQFCRERLHKPAD